MAAVLVRRICGLSSIERPGSSSERPARGSLWRYRARERSVGPVTCCRRVMAVIHAVVFDVGECLVNEAREYGTWADWLGVPRHTFSAVFGAVVARGLDYRVICPRQAARNRTRTAATSRPQLTEPAPAQAGTRPPQINLAEHRIRRKQVLGGLTHEYQVAA